MDSPDLNTFRAVNPVIYSWSTTDIPKYRGWEKIGYTEQKTADERIAEQASQLSVAKLKNWSRKAFYTSEGVEGSFKDHDFHRFLKQRGIERELQPERTEWHHFPGIPRSIDLFNDFAGQVITSDVADIEPEDYVLRPEQQRAVQQALEAFGSGATDVLWNAKPRFGKTLTTFDLALKLGAKKVLIVTNRPAIANSWFDDYTRFIAHQSAYYFVSESPALADRNPLSRQQFRAKVFQDIDHEHPVIEFLSLQDLKGSAYFGGEHEKLKHVADSGWDLLVIDEAHEGIDTTRTDVAFDQIRRAHTLHLSGTPFRALAAGKFAPEHIFNWTYADERAAQEAWSDRAEDNPYEALPRLNMYTYQVSRMVRDQLELGVAVDDEAGNIDFTFSLGEFFATKDNGFFEYEDDVKRFLDTLSTNEKYPFSTPELRDEIRHSFWLLDRVASAKALERLLKAHPTFQEYTIVLAAGDGRSADADLAVVGNSLSRVREAIAEAEKFGGKTITLSVGQLTTGVTVPEWTAVIVLSGITSPALYMQAAFRAQNPHTFTRGNQLLRKKNAYIFDFAPERTLVVYDQFANNLTSNITENTAQRQDNIRELLNFFPVVGEDSEGQMVELDASQVLTFPQVFKAQEVVRRGFLSNLLFDNVAGIFRYTEHFKEILDKLPTAEQGTAHHGRKIEMPEPQPIVNADGTVQVDRQNVINPKVKGLGKAVWSREDLPTVTPDTPRDKTIRQITKVVTEKLKGTREALKQEYGLTEKQQDRDIKSTEAKTRAVVERKLAERDIAHKHLNADLAQAATESMAKAIESQRAQVDLIFNEELASAIAALTEEVAEEVVTREETRKEQTEADKTMEDARAHLRGFARTIPMFLMAYGDRDTRLRNLDEYTPDEVFEEVTGITEAEFRALRDGQEVISDDGTVADIPGLFDEAVFDQSIQEFFNKKEALADYFDESLAEDIFAYIPRQETSLVFTPAPVVALMVEELEQRNPGIFSDPDKTFADLFSTAGLFLMELVRRLDYGLAETIPDQDARLRHIMTAQLFEMSHNEILHAITLEAVSGGVVERKQWMADSGHYRVGDVSKMTKKEREQVLDEMLKGRN